MVKCLAKTTVDLLIDPEVAKSNTFRHDSTNVVNSLNTSINNQNANSNSNSNVGNNNNQNSVSNNLNNEDNAQISFHLNDNFENETGNANQNVQSSTTPPSSSSSLSNSDPQNSDAINLNIPSVGKASTIDNNDLNDTATQGNNNNNNELNNLTDANDYCNNGSMSNSDLYDMNNYKPNREPRGIWLISSLITKLQEPCQTRILEHACEYFIFNI